MKKLGPMAGWLALTTGFIALFFYIVLPDLKSVSTSLTAICLINGIFFFITEGSNLRQNLSSRSALYGANTLVLTAIFLGILIFLNLLTFRHKHRFDFTEGGYFTLAPQTKKFISNLPREVKLTAFFQTDSAEKIAFANLIAGYLEETNKISLQYVDPDKNPSVTKQYGVTTYGTVALESGAKETKIQNTTEENITNALLKVTRDEQKVIYFLEGHGESNIRSTKNEGYSTAKKNLEQDGFVVKPLLLLQSGEIPKDASVLVIPGPKKPFQDEEKEIIDNYLNSGGSVFMLVDPKSSSRMEAFLKKWGIELGEDIVIDPMSKLFGGDFAAPVVDQYTVHEITSDFVLATIFPIIRSVRGIPVAGITTTELLKTGANSWAESDFDSGTVQYDESKDVKGPVSVAVIATKILEAEENSAIPENLEAAKNNKPTLKATLLVVGDSDFSNNRYTNFSGNGDFFLNAISWLAEEENLISIRPKERKNTPIQMTQSWGYAIFIMGVVVFPGLIATIGIRTWWRRRLL
ncbi:MAG: Gldg family protein [Nitrospinota bacterium]|nr:Gldg family protein [Nitrospinota bacterium]